jgi:serine/threonine protein phosphatase PrpC
MTNFVYETALTEHIGGRSEQQDAAALHVSGDKQTAFLVLADGMGGHAGGQQASQAVVVTAARMWDEAGEEIKDPQDFLGRVCIESHREINRIGEEKGIDPRSTCVLLYLSENHAHWMHLGDSRLYRFRDGSLIERTRDHSVVQMLLDMGKVSEEEMGTHPDQNRLTQSLGGESDPEPEFGSEAVEPGDSFLLCSDGFWEMIKPEEMAQLVEAKALLSDSKAMSETAFDRAGDSSDNISIAVARAVIPGAKSAAISNEKPEKKAKSMRGALAFFVATLVAIGAVAAIVRPWEAAPGSGAESASPTAPTTRSATGKKASPSKPEGEAKPQPGADTKEGKRTKRMPGDSIAPRKRSEESGKPSDPAEKPKPSKDAEEPDTKSKPKVGGLKPPTDENKPAPTKPQDGSEKDPAKPGKENSE